MKWKTILALCAVLAVALSGCGGDIVESAVTESQIIDVNEPSAVEQAIEQEDIAFVNENEALLEFVKEFAGVPADAKEYAARQNEKEEKAQQKFLYWNINASDLQAPDETCLEPQQAANAAGRVAKKMGQDVDLVVYMVSQRMPDPTNLQTSRLIYRLTVKQQKENTPPEEMGSVCRVILDAVTGELLQLDTYGLALAQKRDSDSELEQYAQNGQAELQGYLDALGMGQSCTAFENMEKIDDYRASFTTNIDRDSFRVWMENGTIIAVERGGHSY